MNCSRVRKWLPLYVGDDLSPVKARRLENHLDKCPDCQTRLKELRAARDAIRAVADSEAVDWPEVEWKDLIVRVGSGKPEPRRESPLGAIPKRAWAYGFAVVMILAIAILIWKSILLPPAAPRISEIITFTPSQPSRSIATEGAGHGFYPQEVPFRVPVEQRVLDRALLAAGTAPEKTTQDLMTVTLVSQETGLKVHWTFNRNFDWREEKK